MQKNKIILNLTTITLFLTFFLVFNGLMININLIPDDSNKNFNESKQPVHNMRLSISENPIEIDGSATGVGAKNWTWAVSQPWCYGAGTWDQPYVIEYLTINGNETSSCITISNSNVFFRIQNCTLYNSTKALFEDFNAGIELRNVTNGVLYENNCSFNIGFGISLKDTDNVTIQENNIYHNGYDNSYPGQGIYMQYSDLNNILGNFINDSYYRGILIQNCNNNTISYNLINNTEDEDGITIGAWCVDNNITENRIDHTDFGNGIELSSGTATNNLIQENTITNSNFYGLTVISSHSNTLKANNISDHSTFDGIYLYSTHDNIITENYIHSNRRGINIDDSYGNLIENNNASDNSQYGIYLGSSYENKVEGNIITENAVDGLFLTDADNNTIKSNFIDANNRYGMYVPVCEKNLIIENVISNSINNMGLYIVNSNNITVKSNEIKQNFYGIYVPNSDFITFEENNISYSTNDGMYITDASNLTISNNRIYSNSQNGIWLQSDTGNLSIYGNHLYDNTDNGIMVTSTTESNSIYENDIYQNDQNGIRISSAHNQVIEGNDIYKNTDTGVFILNANNTKLIENHIYENQASGIEFYVNSGVSENNTLKGNMINNNTGHGIYINYQSGGFFYNNLILENTIENHTTADGGIYMRQECRYNTIKDNFMNNNYRSIWLYQSHSNTLIGNLINNSLDTALFINDGDLNNITENKLLNSFSYAIRLYLYADNNTIWDNLIQGCDDTGIYLHNSDYTKVFNNIVQNCSGTGIIAKDFGVGGASDYNLIYGNSFINNTLHANDESGTNYWNSSEIGNYWDNYGGVDDSPVDGIGDTPYALTGGTDYLPIWDDDAPTITILSPSNLTWVDFSMNSFSVEITDINLDKMWYGLLGNSEKYFFTSNGTFDTTMWNALWNGVSEGDHLVILFNANDTWGFQATKSLEIIVNTPPLISVSNPLNDTRVGILQNSFSVRITDLNLDEMWYQFVGTSNKYFFLSNGTFDQTAWQAQWNSVNDGESFYIRFYANDTWGLETYTEFLLIKDGAPIISINEPYDTFEYNSTAPDYSISVTDYQIDSMWYTLDGGLTNYTITTTTGTINQSIWETSYDSLSDGETVTLTFYAEDNFGQITSESITLTIDKPTTASPGGIPGYELLLLLGSLMLGSIILLKRKRIS